MSRGFTDGQTDRRSWGRADFIVRLSLSRRLCEEGFLEHPGSNRRRCFSSLGELIFLIQSMLESINFPQVTTRLRSWSETVPALPAGKAEPAQDAAGQGRGDERMTRSTARQGRQGGAPTFFVRIHYRQNATWQGSIQWLEGKSTRYFRSMLEMIILMQEAIAKTSGEEASLQLQSWDDPEQVLS